jgi:hypothetical protein
MTFKVQGDRKVAHITLSNDIVTCYATEDTPFELFLRLFTNLTLQSVIPLYYIYTAHNLTHQYSTEQYKLSSSATSR